MNQVLPRSTPAALLLAAALLVAASGGAMADRLITGHDIKNGSLTGKDVKDGSLSTADLSPSARGGLKGATGPQGLPGAPGAAGVTGRILVSTSKAVTANTQTSLVVTCPIGKKVLGADGYWDVKSDAVQVVYSPDASGATVYTVGINVAGTLHADAVCGTVS